MKNLKEQRVNSRDVIEVGGSYDNDNTLETLQDYPEYFTRNGILWALERINRNDDRNPKIGGAEYHGYFNGHKLTKMYITSLKELNIHTEKRIISQYNYKKYKHDPGNGPRLNETTSTGNMGDVSHSVHGWENDPKRKEKLIKMLKTNSVADVVKELTKSSS